MDNQIVSDAGPLIAFGRIERLDILFYLFDKVIIPTSVANECIIDQSLPGARNIQDAINAENIIVFSDPLVGDKHDSIKILGSGEAAAIELAKSKNLTLLIDEKLGRNVAKLFDISVIGTAGVLLSAKESKIVSEVRPLLSLLQDYGYRLSNELIALVLRKANEK